MTGRERLEKAINDLEKTSVCLDMFDRAITTAKREVWDIVLERAQQAESDGADPIWMLEWCREQKEQYDQHRHLMAD